MDRLLVVDFGGQYAHLIANRLRWLGVLAELCSPEETVREARIKDTKGIVLSGGPSSVYGKGAPLISSRIFSLGLPILGICYGHQLIAYKLDGEVRRGTTKEYGLAKISVEKSKLLVGLKKGEPVWMSHGDSVHALPEGFSRIASSKDCPIAAMANDEKRIYGLQFHPEVTHTPNGSLILDNFIKICGCKKEWSSKRYLDDISSDIIKKAGGKKVFLLVSGGVDSVVLFTLLNKVLGKKRVFGLHVDTGLMRLNESAEVENALRKQGFDNLNVVDASDNFFSALKDITEPEQKRKIIGNLFPKIVEEYSDKILSGGDWLVAQGTIYPDTIESKGTKNAALIKTHHNRVKKMRELIKQGKVIEPLAHLYKDEVRAIGRMLNLPDSLIQRHPFPGPGLAVRMLCSTGENPQEDLVRIKKELRHFCKNVFVLPIKSVGVQGDERTYKHPAVLSIVQSWDELERISTNITNSMPEINRVLLLLKRKHSTRVFTSGSVSEWNANVLKCARSERNLTKKEGDFKLEKKSITRERVELLQKADDLVDDRIKRSHLYDRIWQIPVVLAPLSIKSGESIILRPVESTEAMTARFSRLPMKTIQRISDDLLEMEGIDAVFYDITNKPPATIEWE